MSPKELTQKSKFLSYVLRHRPDEISITLDRAGWVSVDVLLENCARSGHTITDDQLLLIVQANDKKRFEFSADRSMIRARQGHSATVDLGYEPMVPPAVLFHGTAERNLPSIREKGLLKGKRHHVHLSVDYETATKVGQRYGKPVVISVEAEKMHQDNHVFYCTGNNVWLTAHVPAKYLAF